MDLIQKNFDECFFKYKKGVIAIYGVGKNAEHILKNVKGYNIKCLIDEKEIGKSLLGVPVLSLDAALNIVNLIIIAATPSSTKIVYDRIRETVPAEVDVFDIRGHNLKEKESSNPYFELTFEKLCDEIDKNDVITFDIFDTLLMRRIYEPKDVFYVIERELKEAGEDISFAEWRLESEKMIRRTKEPTLNDIYRQMGDVYKLSSDEIEKLKSLELMYEKEILCPRAQVIDALNYAVKNGKDVYLISDMYLTADYLDDLLRRNGINGYKKIFVSSEWGATKCEGRLYKIFIDNVGNEKKILHIGDNWYSDVEVPRDLGISSFWIMNAKDLLEVSSIGKIKNYIKTLDDRILIGNVLSVLFNSPFALSIGKGKVKFNNLADIASTCFVGVALGFISWIIKKIKVQNDSLVLFTSRDCYFLYKLYLDIKDAEPSLKLPTADYFYVSRQALSGVEITSYDKISSFFLHARTAYDKINLKEFLKLTFGTDFDIEYDVLIGDLSDEKFDEFVANIILTNGEKIMALSNDKRKGYLEYLNRIGVSKYKKIYIVDVQTTGKSLISLSNLLNKELGLLTIRLIYNDKNISLLKECAFFRDVSPISSVANKCMILEKVYASSGGQLKTFDSSGYPVFCEDTKYNKEFLGEIQASMKKFIDSYIDCKWYTREYSTKLLLNLFDVIDPIYSVIDESVTDKFATRDYLAGEVNMNVMKYIRPE